MTDKPFDNGQGYTNVIQSPSVHPTAGHPFTNKHSKFDE